MSVFERASAEGPWVPPAAWGAKDSRDIRFENKGPEKSRMCGACRKERYYKMLSLRNISWSSPDSREILKGLDLDIGDGRLVAITGPNGSGKTTLARIIAGIEHPTSGKIFLDGEDITDLDVTQRARAGISYAFQQPVRFKGITVRKLMETAAGEALNERQLCDILGTVGLCAKDYLAREVNATLSGGEIKRIELATVIARRTKLTVFDEPEAGIDLWSFKSLIEVFKNFHREAGRTLIIISHQERILKIADEIILIDGGKVSGRGAKSDMMERVMAQGGVKAACCREEEYLGE